MQFRLLPGLLVFLGSYFPLALILALQDISQASWAAGMCTNFKSCKLPVFNNPWLSLSCVIITGLCFILTFQVLRKLRYKYPVEIVEVKSIPSELISYSFPYIVSFMGVDYSSTGKIVGFAVFLIWLFLITFKAGQTIMNPILIIFGWSLYETKVLVNGHARIARVLSQSRLTPGYYHCEVVQGNYITKGVAQND